MLEPMDDLTGGTAAATAASGSMICTNCYTQSDPRVIRPKNVGDQGLGCLAVVLGVVGIFIWPLLIVAGMLLLVALARMVTSQARSMTVVEGYQCRSCSATGSMVPIDSPRGRELAERNPSPPS